MYGYVYKTTNLLTGVIYVGQKKSETFLAEKYLGSGKLLQQAVSKYGADNFRTDLIEWCCSKESLDEREKYWICFYRSINIHMYNISDGGDGGDVYSRLTEEEKSARNARITKTCLERDTEIVQAIVTQRLTTMAARGIKPGPKTSHTPWNKGKTKETDERIAAASAAVHEYYKHHPGTFTGKHHTPEVIEKIRAASYGNKHGLGNRSTKGCRHIYKGTLNTTVPEADLESYLKDGWQLGHYMRPHKCYNAKQIKCIETGEVYPSLSQAAASLQISAYYIDKCAKTLCEFRGLHFKYI